MKTGIIKSSWIKDLDYRIDASCQLNESRVTKSKLSKLPFPSLTLREVTTKVFNGARFKRYYVQDRNRGIPFLGSSDILKIDIENNKFISKKYTKNIKDLLLEENWVLVSCSGTIGNTVFTNSDFVQKAGSQHMMRVIPKENEILPGFLYAFLSSKIGYILLTQGTYGAVIQHIEPHHIENIPIPIFPETIQKKIHNLITEASELRVEANKLLKEAVEVFEKEIGQSEVHHSYQYGKISSNKIYGFHKRFDSQYHLGWNFIRK